MSVTDSPRARVSYLAELARLELTKEEEKRLAREFETLVEFMGHVQDVEASADPITATISGVRHVLRDDVVVPSTLAEELLRCAPETERRHIRVPLVL
ncbi:MAG: Asp-tRNA(Asn)/Glu-tRNA(Gln) amidotransferase subunit GatC [bacterium]|nr:Asp-tRNA(Asn)/Glu-tRNA(Gln) amidotransferase subunit GatC [bacterium]